MNKALENLQSLSKSINTIQALQDEIDNKNGDLSVLTKSIEQQQEEFSKATLNRKEICEVLGITEPTLIKRRNAGVIPYIKLGNKFYYLRPAKSQKTVKGGSNG